MGKAVGMIRFVFMTAYTEAWQEIYGKAHEQLIAGPRKTAFAILHASMRDGTIIKPEFCEFDDCPDHKTRAYIADYADPLAVIWLCKVHLRELKRATARFLH